MGTTCIIFWWREYYILRYTVLVYLVHIGRGGHGAHLRYGRHDSRAANSIHYRALKLNGSLCLDRIQPDFKRPVAADWPMRLALCSFVKRFGSGGSRWKRRISSEFIKPPTCHEPYFHPSPYPLGSLVGRVGALRRLRIDRRTRGRPVLRLARDEGHYAAHHDRAGRSTLRQETQQ